MKKPAAIELEFLRRRCAELEGQISALNAVPVAPALLPDPQETEELLSIVWVRWPCLEPQDHEWRGRYVEQFLAALRWANHARRCVQPDEGVATSYWLDGCEDWLRRHGLESTVGLRPFCAALIVSRVPYLTLDRFGHDLAWGLTLGDQEPIAWWAETLNSGMLIEPSKAKPRIYHEVQQLDMITGGNGHVGRMDYHRNGYGGEEW
jgi:hypothetical protein